MQRFSVNLIYTEKIFILLKTMSNNISDEVSKANYEHPIFTSDPEQFMQWLYKEICVTMEDGSTLTGRCYTVDPVSQSIVLVKIDQCDNSVDKVKVVMGHCIENVTVLDENIGKYKAILDSLFRGACDDGKTLSPEELESRKESLKLWLLKNRLPVSVSGEDSEILSIAEAVFIEPPYGANQCRSTNEIILGKVQGLIKSMPKDHRDW